MTLVFGELLDYHCPAKLFLFRIQTIFQEVIFSWYQLGCEYSAVGRVLSSVTSKSEGCVLFCVTQSQTPADANSVSSEVTQATATDLI